MASETRAKFVPDRNYSFPVARQLPVETITPNSAPRSAPEPPDSALENFIAPLSGSINSVFGPRNGNFHDGVDIGAPEGTPVHAVAEGEVVYSNQLRGYGNMVIVRHVGGIVSVYAHNQLNLVHEGQKVERGEVIAKVGSTGRVTGPHLHFEIAKTTPRKIDFVLAAVVLFAGIR